MASNITTGVSRSEGFMSGAPTAATFAYALDPEGLLREIVVATLAHANDDLQKQLENDERWAPYSDKVYIQWTGSEFSYEVDGTPEDEEAVNALEYGTQDSPATGLLRKHSMRLSQETSKAVQDHIDKELGFGN